MRSQANPNDVICGIRGTDRLLVFSVHTRRSMQKCRTLGFIVWACFIIACVAIGWAAGQDKCKRFSSEHDGKHLNTTIERICWGEISQPECPVLSGVGMHSSAAWRKDTDRCTGEEAAAGFKCALPDPVCEPGWLGVTANGKCLDGINITCIAPDFGEHLHAWWQPVFDQTAGCRSFNINDLVERTTEDTCAAPVLIGQAASRQLRVEFKNLKRRGLQSAPCVHVCASTTVSIIGDHQVTWVGRQTSRLNDPDAERNVTARLMFDVQINGTLSIAHLRINRTAWNDMPAQGNDPQGGDRSLWQNAIRVWRHGNAMIEHSTLRGIQMYVDPDASVFNLSRVTLVPLVDNDQGSTGQSKLHASCITVCTSTTMGLYSPKDGLCVAAESENADGRGRFFVSSSVLVMTYLNTPVSPVLATTAFIRFTGSTFYMSSHVGGQATPTDSTKLKYLDAMALGGKSPGDPDDATTTTPLFPTSRQIRLDEDHVIRSVVASGADDVLRAEFDGCVLAGCGSEVDFCEADPLNPGNLILHRPSDSDSDFHPHGYDASVYFGQIETPESMPIRTRSGEASSNPNLLNISLSATTPTFGDRLMFSIDVAKDMNVSIRGVSNATSGSPFFLRALLRRANPAIFFFRGGHLRIENLRMDYCNDQLATDSWLPAVGDHQVGDMGDMEVSTVPAHSASLTLVNTYNLYTHIFRNPTKVGWYLPKGGVSGMPNYKDVITLTDVKVAAYSMVANQPTGAVDFRGTCVLDQDYTDCADPGCKPVLTISSATDGPRRFLNITQVKDAGTDVDRFVQWQHQVGDQLFDFNVSWTGLYKGRQCGHTPGDSLSFPVFKVGLMEGRLGVSSGNHLELRNLWLVPELRDSIATDTACCQPAGDHPAATDTCQPASDGSVLKPSVQDQPGSCIPPFGSGSFPITPGQGAGTISFDTVAIQWKRIQAFANSSYFCLTGSTCPRTGQMDALPMNAWGPGGSSTTFVNCEFARSAGAEKKYAVFAAFNLSADALDVELVDDTPKVLFDFSGAGARKITFRGKPLPAATQRPGRERTNLAMRQLLLSAEGLALQNMELSLMLEPPGMYPGVDLANQKFTIRMLNVNIVKRWGEDVMLHSPASMFDGLTRWDADACKEGATWCATMQNVELWQAAPSTVAMESPCIDNGDHTSIAVFNTDTDNTALSTLTVHVSGDGLNLQKAIASASTNGQVAVKGNSLMWCYGPGENTTGCYRLNQSDASAASGCATGASGSTTRAPWINATISVLNASCAEKLCVFENVVLAPDSASDWQQANASLSELSSCIGHPPDQEAKGVRLGTKQLGVDLCHDPSCRGSMVTLTSSCTHRELLAVGNCNCQQQMRWKREAAVALRPMEPVNSTNASAQNVSDGG